MTHLKKPFLIYNLQNSHLILSKWMIAHFHLYIIPWWRILALCYEPKSRDDFLLKPRFSRQGSGCGCVWGSAHIPLPSLKNLGWNKKSFLDWGQVYPITCFQGQCVYWVEGYFTSWKDGLNRYWLLGKRPWDGKNISPLEICLWLCT